ncbi:CCA tRNA nucleotidyltransferase [Bacteroidota bacterium]|nr:CCA tRNA nucleotidyltransferase [Bacteroidota bacterium]
MNLKKELDNKIFDIVKNASEKLGYESFVVGGWVRDLLLNNKNKKDIDFVCIGSGIKLAREVQNLIPNSKISTYSNFGTALVSCEDINYEFIGARKESYRENSRNPIIENGSLEDDQKRRDFTINCLYVKLVGKNYGELLDPFNGLIDLKNKIIKTPLDPDKTFSDDPLRMIRAIRFSAQLNFEICSKTLQSISKNNQRINIVSSERITDELNKIILSSVPSRGFILLKETGILEKIFEEMISLVGVETIEKFSHKDNFYHTLEVLDNISKKTDNLWLRWAAVLHDIAKPITKKFDKKIGWTFHAHDYIGSKMVPKIFKKLKLPQNEKMLYVKKLVALHLRPIVLAQEVVTDSAVRRLLFDAGEDIDDLMTLCDADITSKNPKKVSRYLKNFEVVRKKLKDVEERDKIRNWQPPVTGYEIMKIFNMREGKEVGRLKKAVEEAILDGKIKNEKKSAISYLKKLKK